MQTLTHRKTKANWRVIRVKKIRVKKEVHRELDDAGMLVVSGMTDDEVATELDLRIKERELSDKTYFVQAYWLKIGNWFVGERQLHLTARSYEEAENIARTRYPNRVQFCSSIEKVHYDFDSRLEELLKERDRRLYKREALKWQLQQAEQSRYGVSDEHDEDDTEDDAYESPQELRGQARRSDQEIQTVLQRGRIITAYGSGNRKLCEITYADNAQLTGYTSSTFTVKRGNQIWIYGAKGRVLSSRAYS